jgi:hypothetical protein
MKVLVTGSSGFIGSALVERLRAASHEVVRLVRSASTTAADPANNVFEWDVASGAVDPRALESAAAVVHLAGDNIAAGRWTAAKKARIRASRVDATRKMAEHLASLAPGKRPRVLVCASAIGFYGDRGEELVDETSPPGTGFLADVCRDWEAAPAPTQAAGVRVVQLRTGMAVGRGGALAKMLLPFKLGLGGILGSGRQWVSWIALDDLIAVIERAIANDALRGPVNAVTSNPVTNYEFTKTLGKVLRRPTVFPMPAFAARLAFGEMAREVLLASTRVRPARLEETGFKFRFPELEGALRHALGAAAPAPSGSA